MQMTTPNVEVIDFFKGKALAYTRDQLRYVAAQFVVPCEFKIGTHTMQHTSLEDIESAFQTYRENLVKQDYRETRAMVDYVSQVSPDRIQCLVTYTNFGHDGGTISTEYVSYFMTRTPEGFLRILTAEFVDEPRTDLYAGMEDRIAP